MHNMTFTSLVTPPESGDEAAYWFIFRGYRLLVRLDDDRAWVPLVSEPAELGITAVRQQYLGILHAATGDIHCYTAEVAPDSEPPAGMTFQSLRRLFTRLDEVMLGLAGRAVQIIDWDRTHLFCGRCGAPNEQLAHERAKKCPQCGLTSYPRISPAIIVSVERPSEHGSELLLAHNHRHPTGFYSVLAGFVEPGESLEACVHREVYEEVGIDVKNIRYFGSQPWPFPHSLMIAFTAEYAGGEICLEEEEIAEAGWYTADNLPPVPPPISIARQLIDAFVARNRKPA